MSRPYPEPAELLSDRAEFHMHIAARYAELIRRGLAEKHPESKDRQAFHERMAVVYQKATEELEIAGIYRGG